MDLKYNNKEEQHFLDINWYFRDRYNRLCVVASGGGILPGFLARYESNNNRIHEMVLDLPEKFNSGRNDNISEIIVDLIETENLENYFSDFDSLARRGFYVYDKVDLNKFEHEIYVMVAYPIYNTEVDSLPLDRKKMSLIPKVNKRLIIRTNSRFSNQNFNSFNIIEFVDKNIDIE